MVVEMFRKPTKWSVMRRLILKDIDDLIIGSIIKSVEHLFILTTFTNQELKRL